MKKNNYLLFSLVLAIFVAMFGFVAVHAAYGPPPEKNTVNIRGSAFLPDEITIQKGETLTWINQDSELHTVTGKTFDSGPLLKGQDYKRTFNETGVFDYQCTHHANMAGKVIVQ